MVARRRVVRALPIFVAVAACLVRPSEARAAAGPLSVDIGIGRHFDIGAFQHLISARYHIELRKVVAADVDRDGDLDVVAATDRGFMVWLNDGAGHLTRQPPAHGPAVDGRATGPAWRDRAAPLDEPFQDDVPSVPLPGTYTHAPPAFVPALRCSDDGVRRSQTGLGCRTPRAPPA
jgi:hypothetical protein